VAVFGTWLANHFSITKDFCLKQIKGVPMKFAVTIWVLMLMSTTSFADQSKAFFESAQGKQFSLVKETQLLKSSRGEIVVDREISIDQAIHSINDYIIGIQFIDANNASVTTTKQGQVAMQVAVTNDSSGNSVLNLIQNNTYVLGGTLSFDGLTLTLSRQGCATNDAGDCSAESKNIFEVVK
jgi:hypothetical protein